MIPAASGGVFRLKALATASFTVNASGVAMSKGSASGSGTSTSQDACSPVAA